MNNDIFSNNNLIIIFSISFIVFVLGLIGVFLILKNFLNSVIFFNKTDNYFSNNNFTNFENNNFNIRSQSQPQSQSSWQKFMLRITNIYIKKRYLFIIIVFIPMLVLSFIFFKNLFIAIFTASMLVMILNEIINNYFKKRKEILDMQLIEFIMNMIIMLKAGKEIRQIFKESATTAKNPIQYYLRSFVNEIELNISIDDALDNFAGKIGGNEVNLLANSIKINKKIGGNLIFILEQIIETIQQNMKIRSTLKTQTAQSRFSANFISLFPLIGFIGMFIFFNSEVLAFLSYKIGNLLIIFGSILELVGFFVIKRILKEDLI